MSTDIFSSSSSATRIGQTLRTSTKEKSVSVTEVELASYNARPLSARQLFDRKLLSNHNYVPVLNKRPTLKMAANYGLGDYVDPDVDAPVCVSMQGYISFQLFDNIRVDLTVEKGIRIHNAHHNIILAISSTGSSAALLHPNGKIFQYGSRVEIFAADNSVNKNSKYAKMWHKGISFTSDQCPLVYLVDAAGTRTTTDLFCDLSHDYSYSVFLAEYKPTKTTNEDMRKLIKTITSYTESDGTKNWIINGIRVSQTTDGLVRVSRSGNKILLRTSSINGSASISSPFLHCTGSTGTNSHLFVRRGERRMHYDGKNFTVRNAGHSAGFDEQNQVKVY